MYSPYSESSSEVKDFLGENRIFLAQFKIKDNLPKIESAFLNISSNIELFESVVLATFKESISRGWSEMTDLCERMGVWDFPDVKGNPNWADYLFERVVLDNNTVDQRGLDAVIRSSLACSEARAESLIYHITKIVELDEDDRNARIKNALNIYSKICEKKKIPHDISVNTAFEACIENPDLIMNSRKGNAIAFLDELDKNFPGHLNENNVFLFDLSSKDHNSLIERSVTKIVKEADLSKVTALTKRCIEMCGEHYPSVLLNKLASLRPEDILNNKSIYILKGILSHQSGVEIKDLAIFRQVLNNISNHQEFGHYFDSFLSEVSFTGTPVFMAFVDEMSKLGKKVYLEDQDAKYKDECEELITNLSSLKDVSINPFSDLLGQTKTSYNFVRAYRKASESMPDTFPVIESREKIIKAAACHFIKEYAELSDKKNVDYDKYPIHNLLIKTSRSMSINSAYSMPLATVIALSMSEEEMLLTVNESKPFIKHMVMNGHLSKDHVKKLPPKDRRALVSADLGM